MLNSTGVLNTVPGRVDDGLTLKVSVLPFYLSSVSLGMLSGRINNTEAGKDGPEQRTLTRLV